MFSERLISVIESLLVKYFRFSVLTPHAKEDHFTTLAVFS